MASSSVKKKKSKLCVKNQPNLKKSLRSGKKKTNLCKREETFFRKSCQLATLCGINVCIIYYKPNGELEIWPEVSKVRDMAEKFMRLNEKERMKKSTNIFVICKNKMLQNKPKFSENLTEMEEIVKSELQMLESKLPGVETDEPDQNHQEVVPWDFCATNLSSYGQSGFTTDFGNEQDLSLMSQDESKYSAFLYNHDDVGSLMDQIPNSCSVSTFVDPSPLLMAQQFGNNIDDDLTWTTTQQFGNNIEDLTWTTTQQFGLNINILPPLQMQNQFASWYYQTPSFPDSDMMFCYN